MVTILVGSSCLREIKDSCGATRSLLFTYYESGYFENRYDEIIGNDVFLTIYQDETLAFTNLIPFDNISGNRAYTYYKQIAGDLYIVGWAVKAGSTSALPEFTLGESLLDRYIEMTRVDDGNNLYYPFEEEFYIGALTLQDDKIDVSTTHEIRMVDVACGVRVILEDYDGIFADTDFTINISGIMSRLNLYLQGVGEQAEVEASMQGDGTGYYETGTFKVLPSSDEQTVDISLYADDTLVAVVRTNEKASSGDNIYVHFKFSSEGGVTMASVYLKVNDWEIMNVDVDWM